MYYESTIFFSIFFRLGIVIIPDTDDSFGTEGGGVLLKFTWVY